MKSTWADFDPQLSLRGWVYGILARVGELAKQRDSATVLLRGRSDRGLAAERARAPRRRTGVGARLDGAGGFSRVVAIKRLLPHLVANREFTDMLLNEARLAARERHPNVVATLDVVASKGDVLLVLDYVEGEALSTLCRAQAKQKRELIPTPIAVSIMQDVLHGLTCHPRSGGRTQSERAA